MNPNPVPTPLKLGKRWAGILDYAIEIIKPPISFDGLTPTIEMPFTWLENKYTNIRDMNKDRN